MVSRDPEGSASAKTQALPFGSQLTMTIAALLAFASPTFAQGRRVWIPPEPTPFEKGVTILVMFGVYVWVFALGSIIGSYLNVVAYRLPKGKPLFWPPSSCPVCGARIAIRDNVPILGWILLKGKCRNCSQPISPRYPIVEAIVGLLFLILAIRELFTDGANLPFRESNPQSTVMTTLLFPQPLVIATYLFHAAWLSTIVAVVLIDLDTHPLPAKKILSWMGGLALIAVAIEPRLLPVKILPFEWANGRIWAVAQSLSGVALGAALGSLFGRGATGGPAVALAVTGAYFGWQFALMTGLLGVIPVLVRGVRSPPLWPIKPWLMGIALAGLIQLLTWRWWASWPINLQ